MIITNFLHNFNSIINNSENIEYIINHFYFEAVESMDFDSIICDSCLNNSWYRHAYYSRHVCICGERIHLKITRIICTHCGKTHAILAEPMIPYLSALFDDLMNIIVFNAIIFDYSLCTYLKKKFKVCSNTYPDLVVFNSRNISVIFYST